MKNYFMNWRKTGVVDVIVCLPGQANEAQGIRLINPGVYGDGWERPI